MGKPLTLQILRDHYDVGKPPRRPNGGRTGRPAKYLSDEERAAGQAARAREYYAKHHDEILARARAKREAKGKKKRGGWRKHKTEEARQAAIKESRRKKGVQVNATTNHLKRDGILTPIQVQMGQRMAQDRRIMDHWVVQTGGDHLGHRGFFSLGAGCFMASRRKPAT